jgi:hypothetical protein
MHERPETNSKRIVRFAAAATGALGLLAMGCSGDNPEAGPAGTTTTTISAKERFDAAVKGRIGWLPSIKTVRVNPRDVCAQGRPGQQPFIDTDSSVTSDSKTWKSSVAFITPGATVDQTAASAASGEQYGAVWVDPDAQDAGQGVTGGAGIAFFDAIPERDRQLDRAVAGRIGPGRVCFANATGHLGEDGIPVIDKILPTTFHQLPTAEATQLNMFY